MWPRRKKKPNETEALIKARKAYQESLDQFKKEIGLKIQERVEEATLNAKSYIYVFVPYSLESVAISIAVDLGFEASFDSHYKCIRVSGWD